MIVYHQAFDLYHSVYRILQILSNFNRKDFVELDRLRIWDFYLLFPEKMSSIKLKKEEKDVRTIIKDYVTKKENPYELLSDNRKMFEKIKPYQLSALKSLASYGIIDKEYLQLNRVKVLSKDLIIEYLSKLQPLSAQELNAVKLLTSHFYSIAMFGKDGLKARTNLLESKYDA
jgi:hypothetical protein